MKNDRTRAGRKAARRYNVSPVARAVRSVLTVSAAALMFSGTGLVLAKTPAPAPVVEARASLSHDFAPVIDLTRVSDPWTPRSVVDDGFPTLAAPMGAVDSMFAAAGAPIEGFGPVDDPTVLPGSFHSGPGGVSGSDNVVLYSVDATGWGTGYASGTPLAATSTNGYADVAFVYSGDDILIENNFTNSVATGYTWAAGFEIEGAASAALDNNGAIHATATGDDSIAFGAYVFANDAATITNNNAITATGAGYAADATGIHAAAMDGNASNTNALGASITVAANGTAVGASAFSLYGDATDTNNGTLDVSGYDATGLYAYSVHGDALVTNTGTINADGVYAQGAWARSVDGAANAYNDIGAYVTANGTYGAAGLVAGSIYGSARVDNIGHVTANSTAGVARAILAYGGSATVSTNGIVGAYGNTQAIGIDAEGDHDATVNVTAGSVTASAGGDAIGVWATSNGDTSVTNGGAIDVDAVNGFAHGIDADGYDTSVKNLATIDAFSQYGEAVGIVAAGTYVDVTNSGTINADGATFGTGILVRGADAGVTNFDTINASTHLDGGFAVGVIGMGGDIDVGNAGGITATGTYATGIDVRATGNGSVFNDGGVNAYGADVTGISVRSSGEGGNASVTNQGGVRAEGDLFAVGIQAISRAYRGTANVYNASTVYAVAKYGDAQGVVVSADLDAGVDNEGLVATFGGSSAYGVLALSADGDTIVHNGGAVITVADARGGIAYGVAVQTNNGLASVTNDGLMYTVGDTTAMGIYAATKWNDAEITNNDTLVSLSLYGGATGAIAITYTGEANVTNAYGAQATVQGAYSAGGMRSIALYGDANVVNDGDVTTSAGVLDRGLTARSLYGGTATITNTGSVSTESGYSSYGAWARADGGDAVVHNSGTITSYAHYGVAYGVIAGGYSHADVDNTGGDIRAYAGDTAAGILAYSSGGDAHVDNTGYILGVAGNAAYGVQVFAYGTAGMVNDGTIVASAYNVADGIFASGYTVDITNNASISVDADGWAAGIEANGYNVALLNEPTGTITAYAYAGRATGMFADAAGDATVRNGGDIQVGSYDGDVYGTFARAGTSGNAVLTNGGSIDASSVHGNAFGMAGIGYNADLSNSNDIAANGAGTAIGIYGGGFAHAYIVNNGDVVANADSGQAVGLYSYSVHDVKVVNTDSVTAHANSGRAIGMYGVGGDDILIRNTEGSTVDASIGSGNAYGMVGIGDRVTVTNDGSVTVHGRDAGIAMEAVGGTLHAYNTGSLYAAGGGKYGVAAGIVAEGDGDVTIGNTGGIDAVNAATVYGISAISHSGNTHVDNGDTGVIHAYASMPFGNRATGIYAGALGDAIVDNSGMVYAGGKYAQGIEAFAYAGDAMVTNDGGVHAMSFGPYAIGIQAYAYASDATVDNHGDISAQNVGGAAFGIVAGADDGTATIHNTIGATVYANSDAGFAGGVYAYGSAVEIANGGDIGAYAAQSAVGVGFDAGLSANVTNDGTITVEQTGANPYGPPPLVIEEGNAIGIAGYIGEGGSATVTNQGAISATAYDNAFGIQVESHGDLLVQQGANGTIDVSATNGTAVGIDLFVFADGNPASGTVDNTGAITATGAGAFGIYASGHNTGSTIDVHNGGTIDVSASGIGFAGGILAFGDVVGVVNDTLVNVAATGDFGRATGLYGYGDTSVSVDNGGDVTVTSAYGALGVGAASMHGAAHVTNDGTIVATSAHDATGVRGMGFSVAIDGQGDIDVTGGTYAAGVYAGGKYVTASIGGDVSSTVTGDHGTAFGARVSGYDASLIVGGSLSSSASGHYATAIGALVTGDDVAHASVTGSITASSTGGGQALGLVAYADGDVSLDNGGDIYAISTHNAAIGAIVHSDGGNTTVVNGGTISAHAAGETVGLLVAGGNDASVVNSGTIAATHALYAVALELDADGVASVSNSGTIVAHGDVEGSIAIAGNDNVQSIANGNLIDGALRLGAGDDTFDNATGGNWIVRGHATDFGDGDDAIVNHGTIRMTDAGISLGSNSATGNSFNNAGTLLLQGENTIDMGTGGVVTFAGNNAPIAVLNPVAFENNGTISFLDGAPDDTLSITGDFAGHGALDVDVSLLNGTSDMLYIDGNIVDGSVQSLNINVLDMLTTATQVDIPVVVVTGESQPNNVKAGSIIAGNVGFSASNFLNLQVVVNPHLNASNASVDMFSLTLGFGGINDTGTLGAAIAPGAHSLMASNVGTFRQRMGVFSRLGDSDKGAWVRVFGDKGTIDPTSHMDNLPQGGNFAFDQTNSGIEAGINAMVTDGWYVGASLGSAKGKQDLVHGVGSDDLDGTTVGAYLTYVGENGMYADLSYRWMHFDAELHSLGGRMDSGGDAGALNFEAGWNVWTSEGGLKLVPQVQYTRTEVQNIDTLSGDLADFVSDGGKSSRGRIGLELQQTFKSGSGTTWTPYGVLSAVREFQGENDFTIADTFTGSTSTKGTSAQLELGANARIGKVDVWGGLNWTDGGAIDGVWGGQVGVRYTW